MRTWMRTAVVSGAIFGICGTSAHATTKLGEPIPPNLCGSTFTYLQPVPQYTVPADGLITSWSFQTPPNNGGLSTKHWAQLKVGRVAGPPTPPTQDQYVQSGYWQDWTIIGESSRETLPWDRLSTFPIELPVQAGDVIGLVAECHGYNPHGPPGTGPQWGPILTGRGNQPQGATERFFGSNREQLSIAASFEAFCPADADANAPCDPPNTKITQDPPRQTDEQRVQYSFKSNEPIPTEPTVIKPPLERAKGTESRFECRLDEKRWKECSSPKRLKAGPGEHTFEVRAIDAAGNRDPKPARDRFEVVD